MQTKTDQEKYSSILPTSTLKRLRLLSSTENVRISDLINEGVLAVLQERVSKSLETKALFEVLDRAGM